MSSLDEYIASLRQKVEDNIFSPQFIRLANLYYINHKYQECIKICKTGLEIFPDYTTAKLILLKALIKMEYLGEAESVYNEIENKIQNVELNQLLKSKIDNLKRISIQERIYYPDVQEPEITFKEYEKTIISEIKFKPSVKLSDYLNKKSNFLIDKSKYDLFLTKIGKTGFAIDPVKPKEMKEVEKSGSRDSGVLSNIKIASETLADIYARQGNFKEAFNMYNFLIRAGSPNKSRIESKLTELERTLIKIEDH